VIEKPRWNLTIFKVHFGLMTMKGYTNGERILRFEAIVHNTKQLGCGRTLEKFGEIITRLTAQLDRFANMLDCVDVGFLPEGTLDRLPTPSQVAATRIGGVDINIPRVRAALAAVLALAVAPQGFTVAQFTAQAQAITGQTQDGYSTRQGAYDLRKLRGKQLVAKPGRTRRYHVPGDAARTIAALLTVRDKVIAPSSPESAHHDEAAHPRTGPTSTATTRPSASACTPYSLTLASLPTPLRPHRQHLVDRHSASL
jgi:hypothetical protein